MPERLILKLKASRIYKSLSKKELMMIHRQAKNLHISSPKKLLSKQEMRTFMRMD